jgi:hypothetical protein
MMSRELWSAKTEVTVTAFSCFQDKQYY